MSSLAGHIDLHLPGAGLVAGFCVQGDCQLNGETKLPLAAISGLWDVVREHRHSPGNTVVLAMFTATGAAALLRQPVDGLMNSVVALDCVLDRAARLNQLHEQIAGASTHAHRIRLLERYLLKRVAQIRSDPLVDAAVSWIERMRPTGRIGELTRYIGLSQSALERRFRRQVGTTPKNFASIIRLQRVLQLRADGLDSTAIAHAVGYFDQSHFIKEFRRFSGSAPESFFRRMPAG